MLAQKTFPRVLEPQSLVEFSTVCYQSMYEGNNETKNYLKLIEANYCFPNSNLSDNEKAYMLTFVSTAFHLAKKIKDIERRKFAREEGLKEIRDLCMEEVEILKKLDLKQIQGIRDSDLKKTETIRDEELGKIKDKQSIGDKAKEILPPAVSSFLIGLNYLPPLAAAGVSGAVTMITYTASTLYHAKNRTTKKDVLNDYYDETNVIQYHYREQQQVAENVYSKRKQKLKEKFNRQSKKIEKDSDEQKRKHFYREELKLMKTYETFFGVKLDGDPSSELITESKSAFK